MPFLADPLNFFYRAIRLSEVASTYGISGNIQTLNLGRRSPLLESSVYPLFLIYTNNLIIYTKWKIS